MPLPSCGGGGWWVVVVGGGGGGGVPTISGPDNLEASFLFSVHDTVPHTARILSPSLPVFGKDIGEM